MSRTEVAQRGELTVLKLLALETDGDLLTSYVEEN